MFGKYHSFSICKVSSKYIIELSELETRNPLMNMFWFISDFNESC